MALASLSNRNVHVNKTARWLQAILQFEKYCSASFQKTDNSQSYLVRLYHQFLHENVLEMDIRIHCIRFMIILNKLCPLFCSKQNTACLVRFFQVAGTRYPPVTYSYTFKFFPPSNPNSWDHTPRGSESFSLFSLSLPYLPYFSS